jgi:hypothetical protein
LALGATDSVSVAVAVRSTLPTGAAIPFASTRWTDSSTASGTNTITVDTKTAEFGGANGTALGRYVPNLITTGAVRIKAATTANLTNNVTLKVDLGETTTAGTTIKAGTYAFTAVITHYSDAAAPTVVTKDFNIVATGVAAESKVASQVYSTAVLAAGSTGMNTTVDSAVAAVATASTTAVGVIRIKLNNASNVAGVATESVTATISGPGQIGNGTVFGKSVVLQHTAGDFDLSIRPDGTAGVSTISISTPSVTFGTKTVTFYAAAAKTLTAAVYNPVLKVGANASAVAVTAVDANGTNWAGAAYIVASSAADALVGGSATTPVACSYNSTYKTHFCPVDTLTTGTAKFKVIDAATVALATATSNEVTVTVSNATPATVKLAFDKASYAPFEKAYITVTPLDAAGKTMQGATYSNLLATGGISSTYAFSSGSETLTAVSITTSENNTDATAGAKTYVVYMPASGDVTISATGGTSVAPAGQVKVTATASVVNSSVDAATDAANEATDAANAATDAALAAADAADAATAAAQDASDAVAALSATVAKLVASLKAQITSLTNLVIKIQKKVKA